MMAHVVTRGHGAGKHKLHLHLVAYFLSRDMAAPTGMQIRV